MSRIKALLVIAIIVGFFGSAFAVSFPGDRAGMKADYLYKKLKLTIEQYNKVYPAYLSYEMKVDDLKAKKLDKKAYADEVAKLQAGIDKDMNSVLTKDQLTQWNAMKDKFNKMTWKKKVRKPKTEGTEEVKKDEPKKEVKKEEPKKEVKKEEPKKDVKKEEPKKEEKKK